MKVIRKNIDRIFLVLVLIVLLVLLVVYAFNTLKKKDEVEIVKIDEITEYGYHLHENDTELFRDKFKELKIELSNENINEENYAKLVASLFSIDFYTLNNKVTNMDIGGVEYLYSGIKENFILKSSDTIYKYVKSNIYGDREQDLPIVSNVVIKSIENITFKYGDINDIDAYKVIVIIDYEKDMNYPKEVSLTIVHENDKLVIVEVK